MSVICHPLLKSFLLCLILMKLGLNDAMPMGYKGTEQIASCLLPPTK